MKPPSGSELLEEFKWPDHVTLSNEDPVEVADMVRKQAAWRLRIAKRDTRMFRLRRTGELAMSTTVASLSIYGVFQSISEGRLEGAAMSVIGILWSCGVGREVIRDLNSPEYTDLVITSTRERMHYDATMALLEGKCE